MANPDQNSNSNEAAMNAYMRQVEQFKEDGGEWSNRALEGLRNQSGLSEQRAKLVEDQVFTGEWREAERERLRREEAERLRNNKSPSQYSLQYPHSPQYLPNGGSDEPCGDSGADDPETDF